MFNFVVLSFQLTVADMALHTYIEHVAFEDKLDKYPLLKENRKVFCALPKIKAYLEKRPKTSF